VPERTEDSTFLAYNHATRDGKGATLYMSRDDGGAARAGRGCGWPLLVVVIVVIALLLLGMYFALLYTGGNKGR